MTIPLWGDQYFSTLAASTYREYAFRARNTKEFRQWQRAFRSRLHAVLGLHRIQEGGVTDLAPRMIKQEAFADHVREEWRITTEPGFELPFFLLRPLDKSTRSRPVVITPHGHGIHGKHTYVGAGNESAPDAEGDRDIALQAVRQGYLALAPDMRAFAAMRLSEDIKAERTSSCQLLQVRAIMFGRTLIGERVWDMMRLVDFAATLPDADLDRILITGNSGGGTVTLFAAACDTRFHMAIPGSYFCTFAGSIGHVSHCACNYVPGIMQLGEMYDIAGLIAPRPFLAVHGSQDRIFPRPATEEAFARLKKIYQTAGAEEACQIHFGAEGHRYYKEPVWPFVKQWFQENGGKHR
jgi:dienelactone hydrolase